MPTTQQIVFLQRSGKFKLSDDLQQFGFDERMGKYYVRFHQGKKVLHYNPDKVDVAKFSRQLEPPIRVRRKGDGEVFHHVLGVRVFEGRENRAYRVIFENGDAKNYPAEYLEIEEHIDDKRSINVWEYLNEVAKYNVIPIDDDKTVSLADKYRKMEFVAKNSLLEAYLNVNTYSETAGRPSTPIFPFGCNRSQYKAVRNALENKLSVIQGPPGTGKTQTILNIMANLLLEDKTMQIVSNNNSAVENVKEKLEKEGIDFICAQLGKSINKQAFAQSQTRVYPEMKGWKLDNAKEVKKEAVLLSRELQELYESQEKLAIDSETLSELKTQLERFPDKESLKGKWSVKVLQKYFRICAIEIERRHRLSWFSRLRLRWHRFPISESIVEQIQMQLVSERIKILEKSCAVLKEKSKDTDEKNKRLRELSMQILKDKLARKAGKDQSREIFSTDEIYLKSRAFLKEYPVVLSTTFSATSNINPVYKYDYLIMDEASQVDIAAGALALSCAENAVIVGDLKQLPNVVDAHTEEVVNAIFAKYGLAEAYRYSSNSFLSSVCSLYPKLPQTLLREHYRCNPLIIGFCSKQFYGGELIPMKKDDAPFAPIRVIRTVKGNHARGTVNLRQVETVVHEVVPALEEQFNDIGIIAPYNKQVDAIHAALRLDGRDYPTATVHKFQGRENDAIILSTVDNQVREFTDDPHLLNVAVSRAKKQFTLVVSADEQPDSNIQDLIDYIEYYQGKEETSQIASIYDLLYEDYTKELLKFYETHKRVSEFDSENLTYWAIHAVLVEKGYSHYGILMHYPLRHLITPSSDLSQEERSYASRSWTHLDFLIFDSVSHKAKLAIEVDGTQYHKENSDQGQRDKLKDSVLAAIGITLLRLSTAGSGEKEKIAQALSSSN